MPAEIQTNARLSRAALETPMTNKKCIDPAAARHFIANYQSLLETIPTTKRKANLVAQLTAARDALYANPALLQPALAHLQDQGRFCADDVLQCVGVTAWSERQFSIELKRARS